MIFEQIARLPADDRLISLECDTPLINGVWQIFQSILKAADSVRQYVLTVFQSDQIPNSDNASMEVLLESIRSSKMWPKFVKILEEQKVL